MWRPDGWKTPIVGCNEGADAMLRILRTRGYIKGASLRNVKGAPGWAGISLDSKWYSIPDEEGE